MLFTLLDTAVRTNEYYLQGVEKICTRLKHLKRIMRAALFVASKCQQEKGAGALRGVVYIIVL